MGYARQKVIVTSRTKRKNDEKTKNSKSIKKVARKKK